MLCAICIIVFIVHYFESRRYATTTTVDDANQLPCTSVIVGLQLEMKWTMFTEHTNDEMATKQQEWKELCERHYHNYMQIQNKRKGKIVLSWVFFTFCVHFAVMHLHYTWKLLFFSFRKIADGIGFRYVMESTNDDSWNVHHAFSCVYSSLSWRPFLSLLEQQHSNHYWSIHN